jgi:amidase
LFERCNRVNAVQAIQAEYELHRFGRAVVEWLAQYDALLTPTVAEAPLPLGTIDPLDSSDPMRAFRRSLQFMAFTPVFNITGQPAISIPLFSHTDSVPLGVQLVGQPVAEGESLALAAQLERARPWAQRLPDAQTGVVFRSRRAT